MAIKARAVLSGRAHVFTYADDAYIEAVCRSVVGLPLREAFPEAEYQAVFELFDWARETRRPIAWVVTSPNGYQGIASLRPLGQDLLHEWEPLRVARVGVGLEAPMSALGR